VGEIFHLLCTNQKFFFFAQMEANKEELDLIKLVYSDLVQVSDGGKITVTLSGGIQVVFELPDGYPERFAFHAFYPSLMI
jgi:hypothetical protein